MYRYNRILGILHSQMETEKNPELNVIVSRQLLQNKYSKNKFEHFNIYPFCVSLVA